MQNLIVNSGFEGYASQYCTKSSVPCNINDTKSIYPWTTNHTVQLLEYPGYVYDGQFALSLNSDSPYAISQTVNLQPLQGYQLTFMLTNGGQGACTGYISVGDNLVSFSWDKELQTWKKVYFTFVASDIISNISIGSTTNGTTGPVIDNIILTPVNTVNSTTSLDGTNTGTILLAVFVIVIVIFVVCLSGWLIYYIWATSKWEIGLTRREGDMEMEDMVDECATLNEESLNEEPFIVQVGELFEDYSGQYCSLKQPVCDLNNTNAIYPWTTNHTFEIVQSPGYAYGGVYSISLNTDSPYGISQTVSLTPRQEYVLTLMLANGGSLPCTGYINVSNQIGYFSWTDEMYQWKKVYFSFIPSTQVQIVSIVSTSNGSTGPVIDNIVLYATSVETVQEIELEDMVDDCATLNDEPLIVELQPVADR
ncbi:hypothetical protein HDV01_007154 [Terramyces sp. JEL0728]|nr:hypothetical protein HDV01_007154 [Terramyces sp. JEL0728]